MKKLLLIAGIVGTLWLMFGGSDDTAALPSPPPSSKSVTIETVDIPSGEEDEVAARCHPNYSGCLNPNASDYDCVGGSGNGPYYTGTVQVIGPDVFDLDRDGDGIGCE